MSRKATSRISLTTSQTSTLPRPRQRTAKDTARLALPTSTHPSARPTASTSTPTAPAAVQQTSSSTNRPARRPHPNLAALQEQAFSLTCSGLRSPAIAAQLGVPERTIRRWINTTLLTLAQDAADPDRELDDSTHLDPSHTTDTAATLATTSSAAPEAPHAPTPGPLERLRALAIEGQLSIAHTTRAAYDRLMARHDQLLDQLTSVLLANLTPTAPAQNTDAAGTVATIGAPAPLPPAAALLGRLIPQIEASAIRQLRLAQAAHREVARLQGVTTYAQAGARLAATAEHAAADTQPEHVDDQKVEYVPIEWVDPNDPNAEGLVPRHKFDANAAIDELCNGPRSSYDIADESDDDDDDDEKDEDAILADIIAEQAALNPPAAPSATVPATAPATNPATGREQREQPVSPEAAVARQRRVQEERERLLAQEYSLMKQLAELKNAGNVSPHKTIAARFMGNPHYVF